MPLHDKLGIRMKENYEKVAQTKLTRRIPVAIRIDGNAFHTWTKGFQKPFDNILIESMQETMLYLCQHIQGCVFGYTQSDEITLILVDYNKLETCAWFNYEVQKLCSISASMATMQFNKIFNEKINDYNFPQRYNLRDLGVSEYWDTLKKAAEKGAMFDARCFNIPKEEVTNLIYWRQLDATRNSINMVGQAVFSHRELQNKTCDMIQNMLFTKKNINWNNLPIVKKRGSACIKNENGWFIDEKMPILKGPDRNYIDKLIFINQEE